MSASRYERVCPTHGCAVLESDWYRVRCARGHLIALWDVVFVPAGQVIGWGHVEHGGHIVPHVIADLLEPAAAADAATCPKGHVGDWLTRSDTGKPRCGVCHRESNARYQSSDRGRAMRARVAA